LYLAEGKRDLSAPWARYVGDIAGVTNPKIVIVDLYNQQVGLQSSTIALQNKKANFTQTECRQSVSIAEQSVTITE
jgi:hypothetical protein